MINISIILQSVTFIIVLATFCLISIPLVKQRSIDKLWNDAKVVSSECPRPDTSFLEHKNLDKIIGFCDANKSNANYNQKIIDKFNNLRQRAGNLKNWWNIFGSNCI